VLRYADHIIAIHENRIAFEGNATLFLEKDIAPRCFHVRIAGDASRGYTVSPL